MSGSSATMDTEVPGLSTLESSATAAYIIATPSDNPGAPNNDDEGIWFLTTPGPAAGFQNLPDLGANWVYEGWVVDVSGANPVPYSTGTFSAATGADSDGAGCNGNGPPFPGHDFTAFHCGPILDLDSGNIAVVVSIEPVPDNGAAPFQLKPFASGIATDAVGQNNSAANQTSATFPTGTALLMDTVSIEATGWGAVKALYR